MLRFFSSPTRTWGKTPLNNLSTQLGIKLKNTNVYETENGRYIRANGTYVTQPPPQRNTPQARPSTVSKTKYQELVSSYCYFYKRILVASPDLPQKTVKYMSEMFLVC